MQSATTRDRLTAVADLVQNTNPDNGCGCPPETYAFSSPVRSSALGKWVHSKSFVKSLQYLTVLPCLTISVLLPPSMCHYSNLPLTPLSEERRGHRSRAPYPFWWRARRPRRPIEYTSYWIPGVGVTHFNTWSIGRVSAYLCLTPSDLIFSLPAACLLTLCLVTLSLPDSLCQFCLCLTFSCRLF